MNSVELGDFESAVNLMVEGAINDAPKPTREMYALFVRVIELEAESEGHKKRILDLHDEVNRLRQSAWDAHRRAGREPDDDEEDMPPRKPEPAGTGWEPHILRRWIGFGFITAAVITGALLLRING